MVECLIQKGATVDIHDDGKGLIVLQQLGGLLYPAHSPGAVTIGCGIWYGCLMKGRRRRRVISGWAS